jgi:hypothetical protein
MSTIHNGDAPHGPLRHPRDPFHPDFSRPADCACVPGFHADGPVRVLLVNGAPRSDGSWGGEAAKTWRLTELARATLDGDGVASEVLDLGVVPFDDEDWADTVRAAWQAAHGIIVLAPAQGDAVDGLRAVLARPGTRELLAERVYGIVVHGEMAAIRHARGELADWLDGLGLVDSDSFGPLTSFVGYYEPEDGELMGAEPDFEQEVRNVASAVHKAVTELRAGRVTGVAGTSALTAP